MKNDPPNVKIFIVWAIIALLLAGCGSGSEPQANRDSSENNLSGITSALPSAATISTSPTAFIPTQTVTPTQTATATATVAHTPTATHTPTSTAEPSLTPTAIVPLFEIDLNQVYVRNGPGEAYEIVDVVETGEAYEVIAQAYDHNWYLILVNGAPAWIGASVGSLKNESARSQIEIAATIPSAPAPPTSIPPTALPPTDVPPTAIPTLLPTETPTPVPTVIALPPTPVPPPPSTGGGCCKTCSAGKACGDSCISKDKNCNKGPGCACNASIEPLIELAGALNLFAPPFCSVSSFDVASVDQLQGSK